MNTNTNVRLSTSVIARLAMMTAISVVLLLIVRIPFPPAPFLVYDPADVPIYITAFAFGPAAGLAVTFVVCFLQAFVLGGDGLYGFLMHFVATGLVAVIIGMLYKKEKTKKRAISALIEPAGDAGIYGSTSLNRGRDDSDRHYSVQPA